MAMRTCPRSAGGGAAGLLLGVSTLVLAACDGSSSTEGTPAATTSSGAVGGAGAGGTAGSTAGGAGGHGGVSLGGFHAGGYAATPVRELPNLSSITFYERTGGAAPVSYTFTVDGPELTVRLPDPLSEESHDIPGATTEYYDVYYSDQNGEFDIDGSYLTISGVYDHALPAGGGLNLAEIGLDFDGAATEFGNWVASFVVLGDNQRPESVGNCIDGDLQTHTTMGNTVGVSERLRLTLGFASTSGPPPR